MIHGAWDLLPCPLMLRCYVCNKFYSLPDEEVVCELGVGLAVVCELGVVPTKTRGERNILNLNMAVFLDLGA